MKVISTRKETQDLIRHEKFHGRRVGFVPTMGALHEGHLSLIRHAVRDCDLPVVSIFVNPTQFGPNEDLASYPRREERDLELCRSEGVQVVFLPPPEEIYPPHYKTYVEVKDLGDKLCGRTRPGHFRGVTTVVNLLFHTVMPDKAYFGKKDMQQFLILRRMVKDMGWPIEMIGMPTVREPDGLAMSSRNAYLTEEERAAASLLYRSLLEAKEAFGQGEKSPEALTDMISRKIETEPLFRKDYIELVRKEDLKTPAEASPDDVIALAAYLGKARLIDNIEL